MKAILGQDIRPQVGSEILPPLNPLTSARNEEPVVVLLNEESLTNKPCPCFAQGLLNPLVAGIMAHDSSAERVFEQVLKIQMVAVAREMFEQIRGEFLR